MLLFWLTTLPAPWAAVTADLGGTPPWIFDWIQAKAHLMQELYCSNANRITTIRIQALHNFILTFTVIPLPEFITRVKLNFIPGSISDLPPGLHTAPTPLYVGYRPQITFISQMNVPHFTFVTGNSWPRIGPEDIWWEAQGGRRRVKAREGARGRRPRGAADARGPKGREQDRLEARSTGPGHMSASGGHPLLAGRCAN